jgi:hypothetical protein
MEVTGSKLLRWHDILTELHENQLIGVYNRLHVSVFEPADRRKDGHVHYKNIVLDVVQFMRRILYKVYTTFRD